MSRPEWPFDDQTVEAVWQGGNLVLRPVAEPPQDVEARICAEILARQRLGIVKYGVTLADNPLPLREWLLHMRDEMLDGALYAQRAIDELDASK